MGVYVLKVEGVNFGVVCPIGPMVSMSCWSYVAPSSMSSVYYDKICLKFASHHFFLYAVHICQKSLNFTYTFKCYRQNCSWLHFTWTTLYFIWKTCDLIWIWFEILWFDLKYSRGISRTCSTAEDWRKEEVVQCYCERILCIVVTEWGTNYRLFYTHIIILHTVDYALQFRCD